METPKKILVLGSGGREHALAWRMSQDQGVEQIVVAPGNMGMIDKEKIQLAPLDINSFDEIFKFVQNEEVEFIVVGPEVPLANGIVDYFEKKGVPIYGPNQFSAQLESSKIFSKHLMSKANVPTAYFSTAKSYEEALDQINNWPNQKNIVVKADGLAAGKGVIVTNSRDEAKKAVHDFMVNEDISIKSEEILLEDCLVGKEVSVFALCDGNDYFILGKACDYKRVGEGDTGPNTGGMGCYTPQNWPNFEATKKIEDLVIKPTLKAMKELGSPFKGTLFCGLMVDGDEVNVIEYNVRFGDPETQTLLPTLNGNFTNVLYACAQGKLNQEVKNSLTLKNGVGLHVVMASKGYPSIDKTPVETGHPIQINKNLDSENQQLFFAGVKKQGEFLLNSGGRVLGISVQANDIDQARNEAYELISGIQFEGAHFRRDIGK